MDGPRFLPPHVDALDEARAEVCAATIFSDERPFRGIAGLLDWRLAGRLSALAKNDFLTGRAGEVVMVPGRPRASFDKILIFGLGAKASFDADAFRAWTVAVRRTLSGLAAKRAVVEIAGRGVLAPEERAELLAEESRGAPEALERNVYIDDDVGQRAIVQAIKRSELRTRSA